MSLINLMVSISRIGVIQFAKKCRSNKLLFKKVKEFLLSVPFDITTDFKEVYWFCKYVKIDTELEPRMKEKHANEIKAGVSILTKEINLRGLDESIRLFRQNSMFWKRVSSLLNDVHELWIDIKQNSNPILYEFCVRIGFEPCVYWREFDEDQRNLYKSLADLSRLIEEHGIQKSVELFFKYKKFHDFVNEVLDVDFEITKDDYPILFCFCSNAGINTNSKERHLEISEVRNYEHLFFKGLDDDFYPNDSYQKKQDKKSQKSQKSQKSKQSKQNK